MIDEIDRRLESTLGGTAVTGATAPVREPGKLGMKRALVNGASGFIGGHLVKRLKSEGFWVRGVDLKPHAFTTIPADEFVAGDLRDAGVVSRLVRGVDVVYQLAADMWGADYIATGEHDAEVMHNSAVINLNTLECGVWAGVKSFFYASSACIYPQSQNPPGSQNPKCSENSAYPPAPASEYGWEKVFSERLYFAYQRNYGVQVRVARFHDVFGPEGPWRRGREKAPALICRKVAEAPDGGEIEIRGEGQHPRSYLYVDDCIEGIRRLVDSDFVGPVNLGSEEMVTLDELARTIANIAGKRLSIRWIPDKPDVGGRQSDNRLLRERLGWAPGTRLRVGLEQTYEWIARQVENARLSRAA